MLTSSKMLVQLEQLFLDSTSWKICLHLNYATEWLRRIYVQPQDKQKLVVMRTKRFPRRPHSTFPRDVRQVVTFKRRVLNRLLRSGTWAEHKFACLSITPRAIESLPARYKNNRHQVAGAPSTMTIKKNCTSSWWVLPSPIRRLHMIAEQVEKRRRESLSRPFSRELSSIARSHRRGLAHCMCQEHER